MADQVLYDPMFGDDIQVPEVEVKEAISNNPNLEFDSEKRYNIINQMGEYYNVKGDQVKQNLDRGFTLENEDLKKKRLALEASAKEAEEYDDKNFEAFGWAALSDLSFGLSDHLVAKFMDDGGSYLQKLRENNPWVSGAGSLAGLVGGAFVPGPTMGKVFGALDTFAAKAVQEVAGDLSTSFTKSVLGYGSRVAIEETLQSGVYRFKSLITEDALGTSEFNASNAISAIADWSLAETIIGGTLGGAWGAGSFAMGKYKMKKFSLENNLAKEFNFTTKMVKDELAGLKAKGYSESDIMEAFTDIDLFKKEGMSLDTAEDYLKAVDYVMKNKYGPEIGKVRKAGFDELALKGERVTTNEYLQHNLKSKVQDTFDNTGIKSDSDLELQYEVWEEFADMIKKGAERRGNKFDIFDLDGVVKVINGQEKKYNIYSKIKNGIAITDDLARKSDAWKVVLDDARSFIDGKVNGAGPGWAAELQRVKRPFQFWKSGKLLDKMNERVALRATDAAIDKKDGFFEGVLKDSLGGFVWDAAFDGITGGVGYLKLAQRCGGRLMKWDIQNGTKVFDKMYQMQKYHKGIAEGSAKNFLNGGRAGGIATGLLTGVLSPIFADVEHRRKKKLSKDEKFEYITDRITKLANDPEMLMAETEITGGAAPYMRKSASVAQEKKMSIIDRLNQTIPRTNQTSASAAQAALSHKRFKVPPSEQRKWERDYLRPAVSPYDTLIAMGQGVASITESNSLGEFHPEIKQQWMDEVISAAGDKPVPFKMRVKGSGYFGYPIDSSLNPPTIVKLQQTAQMVAATEQQAPQGLPGGRALEGSGRVESGLNKAINRS